MFNNQRYLTRGVLAEIPSELQLLMWSCIDRMPELKDYLQIFTFESVGILQKIVHTSEQPEYCMNYFIPYSKPITAKVYIIDSDEYSTMLLSEEY